MTDNIPVRGARQQAREALQAVPDAEGDMAPIRQAVARLGRIAAEVARVGGVCARREVGVGD